MGETKRKISLWWCIGLGKIIEFRENVDYMVERERERQICVWVVSCRVDKERE